jgi:hypothetical protein
MFRERDFPATVPTPSHPAGTIKVESDHLEPGSETEEERMTETFESDVIAEALVVIDRALGDMLHRELVSTDEVADVLLDVRSLLTSPPVVRS